MGWKKLGSKKLKVVQQRPDNPLWVCIPSVVGGTVVEQCVRDANTLLTLRYQRVKGRLHTLNHPQ